MQAYCTRIPRPFISQFCDTQRYEEWRTLLFLVSGDSSPMPHLPAHYTVDAVGAHDQISLVDGPVATVHAQWEIPSLVIHPHHGSIGVYPVLMGQRVGEKSQHLLPVEKCQRISEPFAQQSRILTRIVEAIRIGNMSLLKRMDQFLQRIV